MIIKKDELLQKLRNINNRYMYLLEAFRIPSKSTDDIVYSDYLLEDKSGNSGAKLFPKVVEEDTEAQREARLEVMQNKISSKYLQRKRKQPLEGKAARKQLLKKKNVVKMIRKAQQIERKVQQVKEEAKPDPQALKKSAESTFNAAGKIVFSKIQLDENDVSRKGTETDKKKLLRKVLNERKELNELKMSGDAEKYAEVKNKKAWERATAKTLGHKMKDDLGLLSKKIHQRKKQVAKSKKEWADRKQKLEHTKDSKQKKRMENIKERVDQKKNRKMQKLAKKGRIIPGF
ncbi:surfeit locus protein 6 homolog [Ochlerotatus camptorhynchus]|uniref:surfeit locus protein 6 homolog n=1 Tax=Ochlerotatus camptorhynchus TaxID=644619 RepID=UPI0031D2AA39